jgi:hypothetical protein
MDKREPLGRALIIEHLLLGERHAVCRNERLQLAPGVVRLGDELSENA